MRLHQGPPLGVLYAEDFDAEPPGEPTPEPEVIEPSYTLADLDRAREASAIAARAEALAGAEMTALQQRATALDVIAAELRAVRQDVAGEVDEATRAISQTVLALLSAALPSLMDGTAQREVSGMLNRLLPGLYGEPRVVVRLNPHVMDALNGDLAALSEDDRGRLQLVPNDALAPGDVRVSWTDGSFVRDTRALHQAAQAILAAAGLEIHDGE